MKLLFKNALRYYSPYKLYSTIYFVGMILDLIVESFIALSFKFLLDNAIVPQNKGVMFLILAFLILGTIIAKIGYVFRCYLYSKVATGITRDIQNKLFDKLQNLSVDYFSNKKTGDILSHFSNDIASVENMTYMAIPEGLAAIIGIIINIIIIFILEWKLAVIALFGLIICAMGPYIFSKKASISNDKVKEMQGDLLSLVEENIGAQKVIKSFNLHNIARENFKKNSGEFAKESSRAFFLNDLMEITPKIIINSINVMIICVGAFMAFNNYITPGTLVSFNSLFIGLSAAVGALTWVFPFLMKSLSSIKRIQEFLDYDSEVTSDLNLYEITNFKESIEFCDVVFAYTKGEKSLNHINLKILKGKSIAFVGHSGSGKSSILNLIMKFYEPISGQIKIDGIDFKDIDLESIRSLTGIVLQDNFLFNTTIWENLKIVNPKAKDEDIIFAAKAANIHDNIINLSDGYNTVVGERGGKLSGGQRQRIALARALICNPEILILDEATSALDLKTERHINQMLKDLSGDMTIISITHRLENIKDYDYIYVLDKGVIAQSGNHESLISKEGIYSELYGKQGGFVIDDKSSRAEIEVDRLHKIGLFRNLDRKILEEIKGFFVSEHYSSGQNIINLGEFGDRFYIIVRGRVEVKINLYDGKEKTINILEDGDYFGEIALLREVPRTATIKTSIPTLVLSLKRKEFQKILSKNPNVRKELEKEIDLRLMQIKEEGS